MRKLVLLLISTLLLSCTHDELQDNFNDRTYVNPTPFEHEVFAKGYIKNLSGDSVQAFVINCKRTYGQFYSNINYTPANLLDNDSTTLYSLGGLGGSVTFEFDKVQNKDLVVYGNTDCEPAFVQTSLNGREWVSVYNPSEYGVQFVDVRIEIPQPQLTWKEDKNFEFCKVFINDSLTNTNHKVSPVHSNYCPDSISVIELKEVPYISNDYFKKNADKFLEFPDGQKDRSTGYRCEIVLDQPFKYIKFTSMLDSVHAVTGEISPELGLIRLKNK